MVKSKFYIAFIVILIDTVTATDKLLLTMYYENNCPDSQSFILRQLQPAMRQLHEFVKIQYVPFGKATVRSEASLGLVAPVCNQYPGALHFDPDPTRSSRSGSIESGYGGFECQHGPAECVGNMVQDCTLSYMERESDLRKINYVACEMMYKSGSQGDLTCASKAGVNTANVKDCVENGEGTTFQLNDEYWTKQLKPSFIPTITINGVFNQQVQDKAMVDLMGTLCSFLNQVEPCANYYNNKALRNILRNSNVYIVRPNSESDTSNSYSNSISNSYSHSVSSE